MKKMLFFLVLCIIALLTIGCSSEVTEPETISLDDPDRERVIRAVISNSISDANIGGGSYGYMEINKDMGSELDNYIALVRMNFDFKNEANRANEVMRVMTKDIVSNVSRYYITDMSQLVIFWKDDYNNRTVKYAYEYKGGIFTLVDVAGE